MEKKMSSGKHPTRARLLYAIMALVMVFAMAAPDSALASGYTASGLTPDSVITLPKGFVVSPQGTTGVIVKLRGDALASYQGNLPGLAATSPTTTGEDQLNVRSQASQAYLNHLAQTHADFKNAAAKLPGVKITRDFEIVTNSVSLVVPVEQVSSLYALPNV